MSKILKRTGAAFTINDTGDEVPQDGQLIIDPAQYAIYARSNDTITALAAGDLVYNNGSEDMSLSDATLHLQGVNPKRVEIDNITPFAAKKILVNGVEKSLFKRVHGVKSASIPAGQSADIDLVVPYAHAKFTGAEIFGTELGDVVNFTVHDDATNTYSGAPTSPAPDFYPNYELNQFGFDVEMPADRYMNTSDYDADLYSGMIVRCTYTNNGNAAKVISMNGWLHEVK